MSAATHVSLTLARFHELRETGPVNPLNSEGILFLGAAADVRAAATDAKSQQAYKFAILGLHDSEASAHQSHANRAAHAPWILEADEVWTAVLRPFRHFGEANFVDPQNPGPQYTNLAEPPDDCTPIIIVTSVGWNEGDGYDWDRISRFSQGVTGVRISMTGVPGLHSQQSFSFPEGFTWDGITVTFWRNLAAAMAFAYGPGLHRNQVKTQREQSLGDRTSFTRFHVLENEGTWHGTDPLSF